LSVAKLACAIAPHARVIWLACGPGNNGGDGLEAAMHLRIWGREPVVTWLGDEADCPPDALASFQRAREAGVMFANESSAPPARWDMAVDALLGIGAKRAPDGVMRQWLEAMAQSAAPVLQVDVASGLDVDTGCWLSASPAENTINSIASRAYSMTATSHFISQKYTLSLLALKPGLFTAQGRDACGEIWFDDLDVVGDGAAPTAWLSGAAQMALPPRLHASHKGSYGDVAVIGGASGMQGAALLAARAALLSGAGRVFVGLLGDDMPVDLFQPELMLRDVADLDFEGKTVVCGCGGGDMVRRVLPRVISSSQRLVMDADALNALPVDESLQTLLKARAAKNLPTILTPHPLEAARLLGLTTAQVQADRLKAAQTLADRFACTVILKGSGSIIASPDCIPAINPTGDARLATAGTGDVLAGMCGAFLAAMQETDAHAVAQKACWAHGALVSDEPNSSAALNQVIPASALLSRAVSRR
jgi:ADP-dependent NAD(P)H-hydrate dehydratase / NAD(P)H-hydrate epimerase